MPDKDDIVEQAVDQDQLQNGHAKDADGIPYCVLHHCRMKQVSGGKKGSGAAYYACPVPNCEQTAKRVKTNSPGIVPPNPVTCQRCSTDRKPVFCERNPRRSTAAHSVLSCPECGWSSTAMVRPELVAAELTRRNRMPAEEIGRR